MLDFKTIQCTYLLAKLYQKHISNYLPLFTALVKYGHMFDRYTLYIFKVGNSFISEILLTYKTNKRGSGTLMEKHKKTLTSLNI